MSYAVEAGNRDAAGKYKPDWFRDGMSRAGAFAAAVALAGTDTPRYTCVCVIDPENKVVQKFDEAGNL